jgi:hypothetical protein
MTARRYAISHSSTARPRSRVCCATPRPASYSTNTSPRTALVVFAHACWLGAEGIVSKRVDSTYRSGPCRVWIKVRNPASIAVQRERNRLSHRALASLSGTCAHPRVRALNRKRGQRPMAGDSCGAERSVVWSRIGPRPEQSQRGRYRFDPIARGCPACNREINGRGGCAASFGA